VTRDGIIAVCLGSLVLVPLTIWLHIRLSALGERSRLWGWAAMASFLLAWLAVTCFIVTALLLGAVMLMPRSSGA
jgi:hypothetical protein